MALRKTVLLLILCAALAACDYVPMVGGGIRGTGYTGGNMAAGSISGYSFQPPSVSFPGANMVTVTWTNYDAVAHTVTDTAGTPAFDSGSIAPGGMYSFSFPTTVKTYSYRCTIHAGMTGTINVQ
jgi:plastocyanin